MSTEYTDSRARSGVTQTLEYIEELMSSTEKGLRHGYLAIYDARDKKKDIDFQGYSFVKEELRKYMQNFSILKVIPLKKHIQHRLRKNEQELKYLTRGPTTIFFGHTVFSNLAYGSQFVSNNYKERHKIITSIEDELLSCEQFIIKRNYTVAADIKSLK